jgi:hypothetical protein
MNELCNIYPSRPVRTRVCQSPHMSTRRSYHPYHRTSPSPSPIFKQPFFLLSASHRSIHVFILALVAALPTLTVGTIFSILKEQTNNVSSRKLECSLYGTPKQDASRVLPRCGTRSCRVYVDLQFGEWIIVERVGESVNLGNVLARPPWKKFLGFTWSLEVYNSIH